MTTTIVDVTAVAPVTHHEAMRLQAEELDLTGRLSERSVTGSGMRRPTAPPGTCGPCKAPG